MNVFESMEAKIWIDRNTVVNIQTCEKLKCNQIHQVKVKTYKENNKQLLKNVHVNFSNFNFAFQESKVF